MDEAGNTGRKCDEPAQPIHLILALTVDEENIAALHEHIRETGRRHCPGDCQEDQFEFHGHDLYAGNSYFSEMSPSKRIEIYDDILKGIEVAEGEVIVRGVEKAGLQRRYNNPFHPHDIALMYTIESIERMARQHDCRVLLVADEAKEVEDAALRDLAQYQEVGTSWGVYTEQIDHIVDTIHFVPSHSNGGIQLADCATYITARVEKIRAGVVPDNSSARAVEALWETRIEPHLRTRDIWFP
ncbi:MAG TPA: DUF3800 domain-containing protein [Solirubrobacterales bacterium]|nr:DUF3800 domain-containing protein [Solirubrobacterales bacterium]